MNAATKVSEYAEYIYDEEARRIFVAENATLCAALEPSEPLYVLQPIDRCRQARPTELYYTAIKGVAVERATGHIAMDRATCLSFCTYFGSFYETHWAAHTDLSQIGIWVEGSGEVLLSVWRQGPNGTIEPVVTRSMRLNAAQRSVAFFPVCKIPALAGRIFFDIETTSSQAVISNISYVTSTLPTRNVRLGIGLCTFNREPYLVETIKAIQESPFVATGNASILVVNQGKPFSTQFMMALEQGLAENIRVVTQDNLGGAGGFTRAYYEFAADDEITHVLFMDDDIQFSASSLDTAVAFSAFARKQTPVGGSMLDLFQPWLLHEAGARLIDFDWLMPLRHRLDIRSHETLRLLATREPVDYNAWWFFLAPKEVMASAGYPLPIFIKMDDVEYGVRLSHKHGVETVPLSPVSVWHEPFYSKAPNWQIFYTTRNNLILNSLHSTKASLPDPNRFWKRIRNSLLRLNYAEAAMMIFALEEFCAGPARLKTDLKALHQKVIAEFRRWEPGKANIPANPRTISHKGRPRGRLKRFAVAHLSTLRRRLGLSRSGKDVVIPVAEDSIWRVAGLDSYTLADTETHSFQLQMKFDWNRHEELTRRALKAVAAYNRLMKSLYSDWQASFSEMTSRESWRNTFELHEDRHIN